MSKEYKSVDYPTNVLISLYNSTNDLDYTDKIAAELRNRGYRMIGFGAWTNDPDETDPVEEMRKKVLG